MRFISSLAAMIEERSRRDEGYVGKCLTVLISNTVADHLYPPFRQIVFSPIITLIVLLVVYLVFCIIYLPLWTLSLFITSYGAYTVLLILIVLLLRTLAVMIAFPGSNRAVQKEISADFIRRITSHLEQLSSSTANFTAALLMVESGKLSSVEIPQLESKIIEIQSQTKHLPVVARALHASADYLSSRKLTSAEEQRVITELYTAVDSFATNVTEFALTAIPILSSNGGKLPIHSKASAKTNVILLSAGHTLRASEVLKHAAVAAKPAKVEDDGVVSKFKMLLNFNSGVEGSEKLCFPYMLEQLKYKYKAESFSLVGSTKNLIDGVYIPARNDRRSRDGNARDVVLYCPPNAGFYECMSQMDPTSSWIGFYTGLGFDFCLFNYRGYNRSTGSPTPSAVKEDTVKVVDYLRTERNCGKLIVHGESIGGMVACHVVRLCGADLLVCDKTFASLDAVASRLMGTWAGHGLKYIGLWNTDVVSDYLACSCPKIIFQDPADAIISDPASLKNGIALSLVLQDTSWAVRRVPQDYLIASYLKDEMPNIEKELELIHEGLDLMKPLSEAFMTHFYACLLNVGTKAASIESSKCKLIKARPDDADAASSSKLLRSRSSIAGGSSPLPTGGDVSLNSNESSKPRGFLDRVIASRSTDEHDQLPQDQSLDEEANVRSPSQRIEDMCKMSIHDHAISAYSKVWTVLGRIDGGTGQLLGQSLRWGLDGVRAWVCAAIIWQHRSAFDPLMPVNRSTFQIAKEELETMIKDIHASELENDHTVMFIKNAIGCFIKRIEQQKNIVDGNLDTPDVSESQNFSARTYSQRNDVESGQVSSMDSCCEDIRLKAEYGREQISEIMKWHVQEYLLQSQKYQLGSVIPVHCGHNGWVGPAATESYIQYLAERGF